MSLRFLLTLLLCKSLVLSLPIEFKDAVTPLRRTIRQIGGENDFESLFDKSIKEWDTPSKASASTKQINDQFIKPIGSNDENKRNHVFNTFLSGSKSQAGENNWWLGGNGNYLHRPTGSEIFVKANQTSSGLGLQANGIKRFKNYHSLFGNIDFDKPQGKSSGLIGYSHTPTGSELTLGANKNSLGTDLTLAGKTDFTRNDKHNFKGLFSATKKFGQDSSSFDGNLNYVNNPTGNELTFGSKILKEGLFFNGGGTLNLKKNHTLSASLTGKRVGGLWGGTGTLNYKHKPSNSNLLFGFGNNREGKSLFFKGQSDLIANDRHSLKASGLLNHNIGGSTNIGGTIDYLHKPSSSSFGFGVKNNMGRPELLANANINFKNGGKLGIGGSFLNRPGSPSGGFQLSGSF